MEIENVKSEKLIPYEFNNKIHDETQVNRIANSIREFGFLQPLVIDQNNVIIVGHGRFEASQKLGMKELPCVRVENLTDEQIKKFRILDNKLNESERNVDNLKIELNELENFNIGELEISIDELFPDLTVEDDPEKEVEEDTAPKVQETAKIVGVGDLFQLGNHRLMCGDATNQDDIDTLTDGNIIDLVFTDPPYGIKVVGKNGKVGASNITKAKKYSQIIGDETTETAKRNYEIIKQGSKNQILFGGNYFTEFLPASSCWVVRDKENTGNFADVELGWTSFDKGSKLYKRKRNGMTRKGSREIEGKERMHPTQKPVGMIGEILKDFSENNQTILDCFGGSGSTLIACEQLQRKCFMLELDPKYCEVIIKRFHILKPNDEIKCLNREIDFDVLFDE